MKPLYRILFCMMCLIPELAGGAPVATTAGNNLTAYNPNNIGSINNNQWNSLMNGRTGTGSGPVADFGNCNALILRCAQPKCASGGCTSMDVTIPIVNGCVMDNTTCKQYGNDLVQSIAAQIVANSNAKSSQAAQNAAAAAAAQSSQQIAQMQQQMNMQMQQMQQQMQMQNQETVAQLQAALEEQKQIAAAAQQQQINNTQNTTSATTSGLTTAQEEAAMRGIDSDILVREQISGEIMSKLENAETALKTLRDTMKDTFTYAGCDSNGDNCTGPKRVKVFKQKAMGFFDPYNDVLDELYDALITAQAVGVDITDIYMMLNGSCNVWGEYLCSELKTPIFFMFGPITPTYNTSNCGSDGRSKPTMITRGGAACVPGHVIGVEDNPACTLNRTLADMEEVQNIWLDAEKGASGTIRIGCASSALENSAFFRNRKKQASVDIEILERIIEQDAPSSAETEKSSYCYVNDDDKDTLEKYTSLKKLPEKVCATKSKESDNKLSASDCGEDVLYINPTLALCSVHAYNIGLPENPETEDQRSKMRDVIALKTTLMTQQINKQYEYLESMIRRFKTQLEKAILETRLEKSGASTGNSGNSTSLKNNDKYIVLAGTQNCMKMSTVDASLSCLQSNVRIAMDAVSAGNVRDAAKQLEKDLESAKTMGVKNTDGICANLNPSVKQTVSDCATKLNYALMSHIDDRTRGNNKNSFNSKQE